MRNLLANLTVHLCNLVFNEEGQDLVEYGLVVALVAFGAITGLHFLSSAINAAYSRIAFTF